MNRIAFLVFLVPLTLVPVAMPREAQAAATETPFGVTVLRCFHPEATFTSAIYAHGRDHHTWTGYITFREGHRDGATMSFVMDMKTRNGDSFFRVLPLMDDGYSAPASTCYLREWQRY